MYEGTNLLKTFVGEKIVYRFWFSCTCCTSIQDISPLLKGPRGKSDIMLFSHTHKHAHTYISTVIGRQTFIYFYTISLMSNTKCCINKKRSHTQLDSRKQVIAFQDRVITINIKEAQHPLKREKQVIDKSSIMLKISTKSMHRVLV